MRIICEDGTVYDSPNGTEWTSHTDAVRESPTVPIDAGKTIKTVEFTRQEAEIMGMLMDRWAPPETKT